MYSKCTTDKTHSINDNIDNNHIKCKWENEKTNDYQNNFEMDKIHDILLYLSSINPREVTVDTINQISDNLRDILINPAKVTGMHKQLSYKATKKHITTKQPWFNSICKESKINFKKFKKSLPNTYSYINKLAIKQQANLHKQVLRKEKSKYDKQFNENLLQLKDSNPRAFWKIINKDRKKE